VTIFPRVAFLALLFSAPVLSSEALPRSSATPMDASKPAFPETAELRRQLLGKWYGEAELKEGGSRKWLAQRNADGSFRVDFHIASPGEPLFMISELGYWGVAGDVYFTMTRGIVRGERHADADVTDPRLYNAYTIIEAREDSFVYRNVETGSVFSLRKVDSSFLLDDEP
jgi:hypothetical protein